MNTTTAKHAAAWTPARFRTDFLTANRPAGRRRSVWTAK